MIRIQFILFVVLMPLFSFTQVNKNSKLSDTITLEKVFITATRTEINPIDIPASVSVITREQIENYPAFNGDDLLRMIPGLNVDRDYGIFSKNSGITMRGLNSAQRTLVLLDGVPINKTDGGSIDWNRINPDNIDKIEILRGAGSSVYGGSAMSGVINIITHKPTKEIEGKFKTFYGSDNTFGGSLFLDGSKIKDEKGLYWCVNGFYRKGDGYIVAPDSNYNSYSAKTYLNQYNGDAKLGYQFDRNNTLEFDYSYNDDKMGDGTKIFEEEGGYNRYITQFIRGTYNGYLKGFKIVANGFFQLEDYMRQNETIKKTNGSYTLYNTEAFRKDFGIWLTVSKHITPNQNLTIGLDVKQGSVDSQDNYKTSTDILTNIGTMNFGAVFAEHELSLYHDKVKIISGIRFDIAQFRDGSFTIDEPTGLTDFMTDYPTAFTNNTWTSISPKLAALYQFKPNCKFYISYSKGFRAPILDDMCKNGNVSKGFKLANPQLTPENINNIEAGYVYNYKDKIIIEHTVYYSLGSDFQYFVSNGDSVYTGGTTLKPVLKRENVGDAKIYGTEVMLTTKVNTHILIMASYAYQHATISSYHSLSTDKDLTGKYIMEVPPSIFSANAEYRSKYLSAVLTYNFRDKQWSDDDNLTQSDSRSTIDARVSLQYHDKYYISESVQDILNTRFTNTKGELSPGRFFMTSLIYKF